MNAAPLEVGVGLVGTGFMGRAHAIAFMNAPPILDVPVRLTLEHLVDASARRAEEAARQWGFARSGNDWQALVEDRPSHWSQSQHRTACTARSRWQPQQPASTCTARSRSHRPALKRGKWLQPPLPPA